MREVGARVQAQVQAGAVQEARHRVRAAVLLHRSHLRLTQGHVFTTHTNATACTFAAARYPAGYSAWRKQARQPVRSSASVRPVAMTRSAGAMGRRADRGAEQGLHAVLPLALRRHGRQRAAAAAAVADRGVHVQWRLQPPCTSGRLRMWRSNKLEAHLLVPNSRSNCWVPPEPSSWVEHHTHTAQGFNGKQEAHPRADGR